MVFANSDVRGRTTGQQKHTPFRIFLLGFFSFPTETCRKCIFIPFWCLYLQQFGNVFTCPCLLLNPHVRQMRTSKTSECRFFAITSYEPILPFSYCAFLHYLFYCPSPFRYTVTQPVPCALHFSAVRGLASWREGVRKPHRTQRRFDRRLSRKSK